MPIFIILSIIFFIWLKYEINKTSKADNKRTDNFLKREQEANFTRKVDISNLDYIKIPLTSLPFLGNYDEVSSSYTSQKIDTTTKAEILSCEKNIVDLSHKKILNLTGRSNTDIKLEYGSANLEQLIIYDDNFNKLSRNLAKWGRLFFEAEEFDASEKILSLAVSYKSDIEEVFTILAKIYRQTDNENKLKELIKSCDCFDELRKNKIISHISSV